MNKSKIRHCILEVLKRCNIKSYPIDCLDIINNCDIKSISYSSLTSKKRSHCLLVSDESFVLRGTIYYNDDSIEQRMRFSLMHELGHVILGHSENRTPEEEQEANFFASNILAPRMVIHYSRCKNFADVMKKFNLSEQASIIAFDDYKRWIRTSKHRMTELDKEMYNHFYNKDAEKFVWSYQHCDFCYSSMAYNGELFCYECKLAELRKKARSGYIFYDEREQAVENLRNNWLYGGI